MTDKPSIVFSSKGNGCCDCNKCKIGNCNKIDEIIKKHILNKPMNDTNVLRVFTEIERWIDSGWDKWVNDYFTFEPIHDRNDLGICAVFTYSDYQLNVICFNKNNDYIDRSTMILRLLVDYKYLTIDMASQTPVLRTKFNSWFNYSI